MIKRYSNSKLVEDFTNFPKNGFWGVTERVERDPVFVTTSTGSRFARTEPR
jgi:hypothetical protein